MWNEFFEEEQLYKRTMDNKDKMNAQLVAWYYAQTKIDRLTNYINNLKGKIRFSKNFFTKPSKYVLGESYLNIDEQSISNRLLEFYTSTASLLSKENNINVLNNNLNRYDEILIQSILNDPNWLNEEYMDKGRVLKVSRNADVDDMYVTDWYASTTKTIVTENLLPNKKNIIVNLTDAINVNKRELTSLQSNLDKLLNVSFLKEKQVKKSNTKRLMNLLAQLNIHLENENNVLDVLSNIKKDDIAQYLNVIQRYQEQIDYNAILLDMLNQDDKYSVFEYRPGVPLVNQPVANEYLNSINEQLIDWLNQRRIVVENSIIDYREQKIREQETFVSGLEVLLEKLNSQLNDRSRYYSDLTKRSAQERNSLEELSRSVTINDLNKIVVQLEQYARSIIQFLLNGQEDLNQFRHFTQLTDDIVLYYDEGQIDTFRKMSNDMKLVQLDDQSYQVEISARKKQDVTDYQNLIKTMITLGPLVWILQEFKNSSRPTIAPSCLRYLTLLTFMILKNTSEGYTNTLNFNSAIVRVNSLLSSRPSGQNLADIIKYSGNNQTDSIIIYALLNGGQDVYKMLQTLASSTFTK